ncbi:hypothetical protein NP493_90g02000 [Ridgeia piscesae]|uniref:SSD domain-containing protein n=1 Tax=Ridgeia piscesae TaxID=27915 RepID=A0AAD9P8B3_RIDPI|nr:hypothetical protein NP493_90g02000 [Ridgeia piscesae]
MSIFVTSFTTAASFLTNVVSNIIAIQCFGIFAALAIAANLAMMVTIIPAIVVASEAYSACANGRCSASTFGAFYHMFYEVYSWLASRFKNVYLMAIPFVIRRAWRFCIAIGLAIGLAALVIVFYKPGLKPPSTKDFQLFDKDNLLEKWDTDFKNRFPAEIAYANKYQSIFVTILFGFKATDPGNRLNPDDKTKSLSRDADFNVDHDKTQNWLDKFSDEIQKAPFAGRHGKLLSLIFCNYDKYSVLVEIACIHLYRMKPPSANKTLWYTKINHFAARCCESSDMEILTSCVEWLGKHKRMPAITSNMMREARSGSSLYDKKSNASVVFGYRLDVRTTLSYSLSYEDMRTKYDVLSSFMKTQLISAPDGLRSGFFSGNRFFEFYDLQHSLVTGTMTSVGLSIAMSFLVLLIAVRNVLITIYAMLTIVLSFACTVASVILMGWKLNIIESITFMLAIGMSIDFPIHYSVVYQLSRETTSAGRTRQSIERVGSSLAAAAGTTFCAGAAVLNCSVDPYHKIGVFLVLVIVFSWVYSTFFFLSLCHAIGPVKGMCQLHNPITLIRPRKQRISIASS